MKHRQTQSQMRHSQRRPRNGRFRLFVALSIANAVLLLLILLLVPAALRKPDRPSFLGLRSIVVVGNTKYDNDAIVGISGMKVGQSVFSVKKKAVEQALESSFSYIADAQVEISFNREATIRVTEVTELGAVYAGGGWMVVDTAGKGLMWLPIESERPLRRLYLKGVQTISNEVGKQVVSDRSMAIISEIFEAFDTYKLGEVNEIDMSNINNIRVNWNNQISVPWAVNGAQSAFAFRLIAVSLQPLKHHSKTFLKGIEWPLVHVAGGRNLRHLGKTVRTGRAVFA